MRGLLSACLAFPLVAQTVTQPPSISAVALYQAAAQNGIAYIPPVSGQAIINEKSSLNWKNVVLGGASNATIGTAVAGMSKVITLSNPVIIGLTVAYVAYVTWVAPLLSKAAPNPNDIPPVLQIGSSMSSGSENSIYASSVGGVPASTMVKMAKKGTRLAPISTFINGMLVTYQVQGIQVMKNAAGGKIKQFIIVDVLVGTPLSPAAVLKTELKDGLEYEAGRGEFNTNALNGMIASIEARKVGVEPIWMESSKF